MLLAIHQDEVAHEGAGVAAASSGAGLCFVGQRQHRLARRVDELHSVALDFHDVGVAAYQPEGRVVFGLDKRQGVGLPDAREQGMESGRIGEGARIGDRFIGQYAFGHFGLHRAWMIAGLRRSAIGSSEGNATGALQYAATLNKLGFQSRRRVDCGLGGGQ